MMYNGTRSWPPVWVSRNGNVTTNPKGEVGILLDVALSRVPAKSSCFLIMEHLGAEYIGSLLMNDRNFCQLVFDALLQNRFKLIREIGGVCFCFFPCHLLPPRIAHTFFSFQYPKPLPLSLFAVL